MIQKMGLNSLMIVIVNHNVSFSIILMMYLLTLMRFDRIKCASRYFLEIFNGTPLQYSCLENPMDGGAW